MRRSKWPHLYYFYISFKQTRYMCGCMCIIYIIKYKQRTLLIFLSSYLVEPTWMSSCCQCSDLPWWHKNRWREFESVISEQWIPIYHCPWTGPCPRKMWIWNRSDLVVSPIKFIIYRPNWSIWTSALSMMDYWCKGIERGGRMVLFEIGELTSESVVFDQ